MPGITDDQTVGLVEVGGDLGDELGGAEADGRGQAAGGVVDIGTDPLGEGAHRGDLEVGQVGLLEVDEGLVQRQRLHERRDLAQQSHHDHAGVAVGVEPAGEERRVRAAGAGLAGRHGRADAVLPGLVGRGRHHPAAAGAADHDGLSAQGRLVALLDGCEERVQIEVEDRGLVAHVRTVLPAPDRPPAAHRRRRDGLVPRSARHGPAASVPLGSVLDMTTTPARQVLTFRTPEDVLAAVPVLLGFEPADSVVMLTFGGRETFHARVDLPPPRHLDEAVELLLEPALAHGVEQALFVVYSDRARLAERLLVRLGQAFASGGVRVVGTLRADGSRWFLPGCPGVAYDVGTHPFRVRSVIEGQVVTGSRDELAARLRPTTGVGPVERARGQVPAYDAIEVAASVWRALERGQFEDHDLAGVLQGMRDLAVRDAAWGSMTRGRGGRPRHPVDRRGAAFSRPTSSARPRRCWPWPRGWRAAVLSPGARSTGASR